MIPHWRRERNQRITQGREHTQVYRVVTWGWIKDKGWIKKGPLCFRSFPILRVLQNTHQTHKEVCSDHTEQQEEATILQDSLAEKAHLDTRVYKGARPAKRKPLLPHKKADRGRGAPCWDGKRLRRARHQTQA